MSLFQKDKNSKSLRTIKSFKKSLSGKDFLDALSKTTTKEGIKALIDSLEDEELRWSATLSLGRIKSPEVADALIEIFNTPGKEVDIYRSIAWILGEIGHEKAISSLSKVLEDRSKDVELRRNAAQSLGKIGSVEAAECLVEALQDDRVRQNAAQALGKIKSFSLVEYLHTYLWDKDPGMRQGVTWALREIRSEKSIQPLIEALEDEEKKVRNGATWALKQIFSHKNEDMMLEILATRKEKEIRKRAVKVLQRIGSPQTIRQLERLNLKVPPENREEILEAIKGLKKR